MIIWLASYPRSGNTLLRTVLSQTMGLGSYSDVERPLEYRLHADARKSFGNLEFSGSWNDFYHHACNSKELFLIKTHCAPRDDHPAIYVVRDGRAATESYLAFHQSFTDESAPHPRSLLALSLGDDYYGDWSSHYQIWNPPAQTRRLLLRFEDLEHADQTLLDRLQQFVGYQGQVRPFVNPFLQLQSVNPEFFRHGTSTWQADAAWTEELQAIFIALHGELLEQLAYISPEQRHAARAKLSANTLQLIQMANQGFAQRNAWHLEAQAKEQVIQEFIKVTGGPGGPLRQLLRRTLSCLNRQAPS
jgi:hypothetical protein